MLSLAPSETTHSVAFHTLGCKTNQLETSAIAEQFRTRGWRVVNFDDAASLYVINTCTVTERADTESQRMIRKAKLSNPQAKVAVTGCYAQVNPVEVSQLPNVDYVIGNADKENIASIIETYPELTQPLVQVTNIDKSRILAAGMESGLDRTRASLKIQDGCDYKCTYCIIWEARGPSRSLPVTDLQTAMARLVAEGFHEVTLTGINIGQYNHSGTDLAGLLTALMEVSGRTRIRLTSLDPLEVDEALIQVIANSNGRICPHIHLSAQSASDPVLKRMARRHHVKDFKQICQAVKRVLPRACIGSDIIVGFPGESETEFEETRQVLTETPIDYLHVFSYSKRRGTPAATYRAQVPQRVIQSRANMLIKLSEQKFMSYRQSFLEDQQILDVIVENNGQKGMSAEYIRVTLDASDSLERNERVLVRIAGLSGETTHAQVLSLAK